MGILKNPKPMDKAASSTAKRKSIQNNIDNLKPLKPGGALGFSTFRDANTRPNLSDSSKTKPAYENAMESDEEEGDGVDKTDKLVDVEGEDFKNSMLSPEDVKKQGELAEGVKKIKVYCSSVLIYLDVQADMCQTNTNWTSVKTPALL